MGTRMKGDDSDVWFFCTTHLTQTHTPPHQRDYQLQQVKDVRCIKKADISQLHHLRINSTIVSLIIGCTLENIQTSVYWINHLFRDQVMMVFQIPQLSCSTHVLIFWGCWTLFYIKSICERCDKGMSFIGKDLYCHFTIKIAQRDHRFRWRVGQSRCNCSPHNGPVRAWSA